MVEKIPVRPESVRGLGNIISPAKTLDDFSVFNSSLSYVDGFYTMEYVTSNVIVELTASASSITVGESLVLTATVTDNGTAVEGASVSFTSGNLVIGTDMTDENGVASVTTSTLEEGSYSITATYDEVVSSAVSVTVNTAFTSVTVTSDKSILSYADSESATLTAQLMNGALTASVGGETVEFYRYVDGTNDVLVDSGQTDNNGVATGTYTSAGIGDIQVYAKVRSLVSKTYDIQDCIDTILGDTDQSSKFGSSITLRNNGAGTISYDSTNKYYKWSNTVNNSESFIPLNNITGLNDFTMEFDAYIDYSSSITGIAGLTAYKDNNNWLRITNVYTKKSYYLKVNGTGSEDEINATNISNKWVHFKLTVTNNTVTKEVYDGDTLVDSASQSLDSSFFTSTTKYGLPVLWQTIWSNHTLLKNFKIKPL